MATICFSSTYAADDETPLWQNGFSSWNGSGYDFPASSAMVPSSVTVPSAVTDLDVPAPYTVPVDPAAQIPLPSTYALPSSDSPEREAPSSSSERMLLPPLEEGSTPAYSDALAGLANENQTVPSAELPLPAADSSELNSANGAQPIASDSYDPLPVPATQMNQTQMNEATDGDATNDIARQVNVGEAAEPAPLESEVIRWYQYPQRWMRGWDSHAEFGLDGSDGNANTLAIQTGMELKRKTDTYTLGIDVDYRQANARNKTTEENGRFNVDYDRLIADSPWSAFGKYGMEWDRFKAFDLRINLNGGLGYYWLRTDDTTLATRFGAGASREIGAPIDDWIPEAVFGLEAERQLTARQKLKGKVDYFPAWEDFGDYRLVSDVAWEILLDGSENLSLKLAATDRYDSTPQGARPNDVYYSLLLLYKF